MAVQEADSSNALLASIRDGTYPESESLLTADLKGDALQSSLELVENVKHQLEADIRGLSQNSSSNVDEWIAQARRLQEDIQRSKALAHEVVNSFEDVQKLSSQTHDTRAKLNLLRNEKLFNQAVISSLSDIVLVDESLNKTELSVNAGRLVEVAAELEELSTRTKLLTDSNAKEIHFNRLSRIQDVVVEGLATAAASMVDFPKSDGQLRVVINQRKHDILGVPLDYLSDALEKLEALDKLLRTLSMAIRRKVCQPALSRSWERIVCSFNQDACSLVLSSSESIKDVEDVLESLSSIFTFINTQFPARLGFMLGTAVSEEVIGTLIQEWLTPSVPLRLSDLPESHKVEAKVRRLADQISSYEWPGYKELIGWVDRLPQVWLERRCTSSLDEVRKAYIARRGPNREVERVERQNVSREDVAFPAKAMGERDANWRQEEPVSTTTTNPEVAKKVDEDLSAWDFDDEPDVSADEVSSASKANDDGDDSNDSWGWDEETTEAGQRDGSAADDRRVHPMPVDGHSEKHEVTLTETYTITDIPDQLLDIISRAVHDAEQLRSSEYAAFESISASTGLLSLPTLIFAMFRATAATYYTSTIPNGNMHLYNDSMYVVEKLQDLATNTSLPQLGKDGAILHRFARSAYGREMEVQRTIIGDLLDGAQSFVNCTRFPYSAECENAISSTVDRIRAVHHDWRPILSRSALLQSIGSLLYTVIEKIVKDVEDMEDISEAESQRLASFCGQVSALEDLFMLDQAAATRGAEDTEGSAVPLTAVYVSNWLRFQYLANILDSSLVDIKYLWTEGELGMEFTANEVIDLIQALFAESSHRRSAITEIRRNRR